MKKKEEVFGHKQGKNYGYTLLPNGDIEICDIYAQQLAQITAEKSAVEEILRSITANTTKLLIEIHKRQMCFWNTIVEDYGLSKDDLYTIRCGNILKKEVKEEKPKLER